MAIGLGPPTVAETFCPKVAINHRFRSLDDRRRTDGDELLPNQTFRKIFAPRVWRKSGLKSGECGQFGQDSQKTSEKKVPGSLGLTWCPEELGGMSQKIGRFKPLGVNGWLTNAGQLRLDLQDLPISQAEKVEEFR